LIAATSNGAAIELRTKGLRNHLVGPIDFTVACGTCVTMSGQSGSGKSVLLRMIADLDPHEGDAWLDDRSRSSMDAHLWRRAVGYVPAESGWWSDRVCDHFSALDVAKAMAPAIGLPVPLFDVAVARLSTGEKQRMALLRAISVSPTILLLDEPCSALDETTTLKVENLLNTMISKGLGLVIVSHNEAQVQRMGHRKFHMLAGQLHERAA